MISGHVLYQNKILFIINHNHNKVLTQFRIDNEAGWFERANPLYDRLDVESFVCGRFNCIRSWKKKRLNVWHHRV